jgi:hypothetical protein
MTAPAEGSVIFISASYEFVLHDLILQRWSDGLPKASAVLSRFIGGDETSAYTWSRNQRGLSKLYRQAVIVTFKNLDFRVEEQYFLQCTDSGTLNVLFNSTPKQFHNAIIVRSCQTARMFLGISIASKKSRVKRTLKRLALATLTTLIHRVSDYPTNVYKVTSSSRILK